MVSLAHDREPSPPLSGPGTDGAWPWLPGLQRRAADVKVSTQPRFTAVALRTVGESTFVAPLTSDAVMAVESGRLMTIPGANLCP